MWAGLLKGLIGLAGLPLRTVPGNRGPSGGPRGGPCYSALFLLSVLLLQLAAAAVVVAVAAEATRQMLHWGAVWFAS